ncbi:VWA domain-containing protein [Streptomyces sp. NPDC002676]
MAVKPEAVEPEAVEPLAEEPEAVEPEAAELVTEEPQAVELETEEAKAEEAEAEEAEAEQPAAAEPAAAELEAAEPLAEEPEAAELKAEEPLAAEPEAVEPVAVEPEPADLVTVEQEAAELKAEEPEDGEPLAEEPEAAELKAEEPLAAEPEAVEPNAAEPLVAEPMAIEPEAAEPMAVEPEPAELVAEEPQAEEPEAAELEAAEPLAEEPVAEKPEPIEPEAEEPEASEPLAAEPMATEPEAVAEAEESHAAADADGEGAPQGAPVVDDETGTGGADGNEIATPATPLTHVRDNAPTLVTAYKAAQTTLEEAGLTGTRAKLYLVLDRSASMRPYYKDGSAQALADQTLALAAHLDPEATVHTVFFSTEVDGTTDLTLATGHETKIDDVHAGLGRMGRTSYHAAVEAVLAHHEKTTDDPATPVLVVFQTDGAPDAKTPATQSLTEAAKNHPSVFFSFVAFGEHDNKAFDYLRKLKTGNTSFFHAGPTPRELTDTELYQGVLAAWRP